jgi:arabinofuranosyltransferase
MTDPSMPAADRAPAGGSSRADVLFASLIVVLLALFVTHAWVVDDAYITLRAVDNFVHGLGLRWNVDERVQAYTHPLWMFVLAAFYAITRESFITTLAVSFATSVAAVVVAARAICGPDAGWRKALLVGELLASKAFLDFSSSGLENPLTHLLLALFFFRFLFPQTPWQEASPRQVTWLFLLAAIGFLNRQDTMLFFLPACLFVLHAQLRTGRPRVLRVFRSIGLGLAPAMAWLLFAFLYYGSIVPNTAYAKLIGPRLAAREKLQSGAAYFLDSIYMDFATLPLCALALYLCSRRRNPAFLCAAGGMVLYLVYVFVAGAVGTHMSGRFFSGPLFLSAILIALLVRNWRQAVPIAGLSALVLVASPYSPLKVGTSQYATQRMARPDGIIIDTREYVIQEGSALLNVSYRGRMPAHSAYHAGLQMKHKSAKASIGGPAPFFNMIGYAGFAAGPDKAIVDALGLSDPLIARLPVALDADWRPGHFFRDVPAGYLASVEKGMNLVEDQDLRPYYEAVRVVTRAPVFSGARLATLFRFAFGRYDHHLQAYAASHKLRW